MKRNSSFAVRPRQADWQPKLERDDKVTRNRNLNTKAGVYKDLLKCMSQLQYIDSDAVLVLTVVAA